MTGLTEVRRDLSLAIRAWFQLALLLLVHKELAAGGRAPLSESGFSGFSGLAGFSGFRFSQIALFVIAVDFGKVNMGERLRVKDEPDES